MAMNISVRQLEELDRRFLGMTNKVKRIQAEADKTVLQVVRTAEIGGTAFAMGVINGRWKSPELLGVPVDLGVSIAMHIGGFIFDKSADHLHAVGDGALASYMTALGTGVGNKMLVETQQAAARLAAAAAQTPPA